MRGHRADKNALRGNNDLCRLRKCCCGRPTARPIVYRRFKKRVYNRVYPTYVPAHATEHPILPLVQLFTLCAPLSAIDSPYYLSFNKRRICIFPVYLRSITRLWFFFSLSLLIEYREMRYLRKIGINKISSSFLTRGSARKATLIFVGNSTTILRRGKGV